jgi:hypothetical protein
MLIIRSEQVAVFGDVGLAAFEQRVASEMESCFPRHCAGMSAARVHAKVMMSFERAQRFGFKTENGLRLFAELGFLLGLEFDDDPQHPWVREIMEGCEPEVERVEALYHAANAFMTAVNGPGGAFIDAALRRAQLERPERGPDLRRADFEKYMSARLQ